MTRPWHIVALVLGVLLVLLGMFACARVAPYVREPRPCQEAAVDLVWRAVFGRTDPAPTVWWVPPADLDCTGVTGRPGFKAVQGCVAGQAAANNVDLVWYGSFEDTPFAHELAHAAQARDGLPADYQHASAPFQAGGAVDQANARLAAARLCGP